MNEVNSSRQLVLFAAALAQSLERYDDLLVQVKKLVAFRCPLSSRERDILAIAYKQAVAPHRKMLKLLATELQENERRKRRRMDRQQTIVAYQQLTWAKFFGLCNEVIEMVDDVLLPGAADPPSKVFYLQLKADYCRYELEFINLQQSEEKEGLYVQLLQKTTQCYFDALLIARSIGQADPIRLNLMLNFSVFQYNDQNSKEKALDIAEKTFDAAYKQLDQLSEQSFQAALLILQVIQENYQKWKKAEQELKQAEQGNFPKPVAAGQ